MVINGKMLVRGSMIFWVAAFLATVQQAPVSAAPFYQGKVLRIVVSASPGGGFDTFARLLARHIGQYIPGNPRTIVVNMPGGSHLVAANRIYAMRPGDGLTMVNFHYGKVAQAFIGDPLVRFDPMKYQWLGDPTLGSLPQVLWVRTDLGIRTLEDLKNRKEPLALGTTGMGTSPAVMAEFLKSIGYAVKNVTGYRGSANTFAALERNELHGRIISQASMQTVYRRFLERDFVRPLLSIGKEPRLKPLAGVPTLEDLKLSTANRELAEFMINTWALLRTYAVPPGTPEDRVKILRQAFLKALKSPKLIKDAKRQGVIVDPVSGEEVTKTIQKLSKLTRSNPKILKRYKKLAGVK